jgi:hypothetical protein
VDRAARLRLIGLAVALGAVVPRAAITHGPALCPVRRLTGYPCPTCGMVRSWHSLARLEPRRAVRDHPFGPIALVAAAAEAWSPGLVERGMERARLLPAQVQAGVLVAWTGWWGARLFAAWRARRAR